MTPPRLEACSFGAGAGDQWPRLTRVLAHSAAVQCPDWQVHIETLKALPASQDDGYHANTQKLDYWAAVVAAAPDGTRLLLIDVDTVILRPLDDIWQRDFDVAYTTKVARYPLNAGVVFLRVSSATRAWMTTWRDENRRMLKDQAYHRPWRQRFAGINQAALGALLEHPLSRPLTLLQLPCPEWNCEDASWAQFDDQVTRILHVKSSLRRAVFHQNRASVPAVLRGLAKRWHALEKAAA